MDTELGAGSGNDGQGAGLRERAEVAYSGSAGRADGGTRAPRCCADGVGGAWGSWAAARAAAAAAGEAAPSAVARTTQVGLSAPQSLPGPRLCPGSGCAGGSAG